MQEGSYLENKFRVEPDTRIMPWKQLFPVPHLTIFGSYDSVLLILPLKENGRLNIPLLELVVVFEVDVTSCFAGSKVGAAVAVTIGASGIVISEGISLLR